MNFRTRLREEIEFSGMTDKEVAARAGISKRALDSYVGGQNCMPSAEVAVKLAKVLGTSVEYLVEGTVINLGFTEPDAKAKELFHSFVKLSDKNKNLLISFCKLMEDR
ncbi:helix-turn-helix transcriptional regulator [Treponema sp.]|uniref:helix-turn-helix domain-containing protein n=1 Tax=Treponema sp. TaxID=166 RepID=UPI00257A08A1|nr:helix-turn-helix transcriptional regulator [Treponema sp.]MBE6354865.1 helix-turn-helix transcriptional regulator [Treponema sp.]